LLFGVEQVTSYRIKFNRNLLIINDLFTGLTVLDLNHVPAHYE
jgi:hypothetical protein